MGWCGEDESPWCSTVAGTPTCNLCLAAVHSILYCFIKSSRDGLEEPTRWRMVLYWFKRRVHAGWYCCGETASRTWARSR